MSTDGNKLTPSFHHLHPDDVIMLVERSLARDFTNLFRPLNSYINRVFELEDQCGKGVIVKFYRPGRWSRRAILAEHRFLKELEQYDIPVISPFTLKNGQTLGNWHQVNFAVFPKCGGRSIDEFNEDQWRSLGRLIGRVHRVGATRKTSSRKILAPGEVMQEHIEYLRSKKLIPREVQKNFHSLVKELSKQIEPLFDKVVFQRIHGDLHLSNIIYRPGESFYIIDFDDMVTGPQVQDIWMLLTSYGEESFSELEMFLEGYETFHTFDRRSCRLIEPLRAMRFIHYLAWCGYQVVEDGDTQVVSDYRSIAFWHRELGDLEDQLQRIKQAESGPTFY